MTRISYSTAWIRPADHADTNYDDVSGLVTWDGNFEIDPAGNTKVTLSNGFTPFFTGTTQAAVALDVRGSCAPSAGCATRVSYGPAWAPAADHPNFFDDAEGVLTTDGVCRSHGDSSSLLLSNGWEPHFHGGNACTLALRYTQCGGL